MQKRWASGWQNAGRHKEKRPSFYIERERETTPKWAWSDKWAARQSRELRVSFIVERWWNHACVYAPRRFSLDGAVSAITWFVSPFLRFSTHLSTAAEAKAHFVFFQTRKSRRLAELLHHNADDTLPVTISSHAIILSRRAWTMSTFL